MGKFKILLIPRLRCATKSKSSLCDTEARSNQADFTRRRDFQFSLKWTGNFFISFSGQ